MRMPGLRVRAMAAYEGTLRTAVLATKDGRRDVAESLGRFIAAIVPADSVLIPVPTTRARARVRGFDGVEAIARCAALAAGALVMPALWQRTSDAQRGRSRSQRIAARGRFVCGPEVGGARVVLIDDVCTTGSTLHDCAQAVRAAGGTVEEAVVVAIALPQAGRGEPATKSASPWRPTIAG